MLAGGTYYPWSCDPEDVFAAIGQDHVNYFFSDVQVRGRYAPYAVKMMARRGVTPQMEAGDKQVLAEGTVDFVSFSYYSSRCISAHPEKTGAMQTTNAARTLHNPHLASTQWGWQIDPLGLRIVLNTSTTATRSLCSSWKTAWAPGTRWSRTAASTTATASTTCAATSPR